MLDKCSGSEQRPSENVALGLTLQFCRLLSTDTLTPCSHFQASACHAFNPSKRPGLREAGRAGCRYSWEPLQTKTNAVFLAETFRVKAAGCTHHSQGRGMVLGGGSCPALAEGLSPLNHLNSNLSLWAPVSLTLFGRTHLLYVMENQPEERFQVLSAISGERRG